MTDDSSSNRMQNIAIMPRSTRRSLPIALLRAREAMMMYFRPLLARYDITEQQWRVLRILAEAGIVDASQVAQEAFILAPSLTRIIRSLEERQLLSKEKDPEDGRRLMLSITEEGRKVIAEVSPQSRKIYASIETRYGVEKLDLLLDMLNDLAELEDEGD